MLNVWQVFQRKEETPTHTDCHSADAFIKSFQSKATLTHAAILAVPVFSLGGTGGCESEPQQILLEICTGNSRPRKVAWNLLERLHLKQNQNIIWKSHVELFSHAYLQTDLSVSGLFIMFIFFKLKRIIEPERF